MTKMNRSEIRLQMYEGAKKLIVEILVEVISGVIAKFLSGTPGRQTNKRAAETPA